MVKPRILILMHYLELGGVEKINTQMRDFLAFLGLSERLLDSPMQVTADKIDFTTAEAKLSQLLQQSKRFISEQINYAQ